MATITKPGAGIKSPFRLVKDNDGKLIATIARTDTCATYGGECWHLLHNNGRCDHFERYSETREEALKL